MFIPKPGEVPLKTPASHVKGVNPPGVAANPIVGFGVLRGKGLVTGSSGVKRNTSSRGV